MGEYSCLREVSLGVDKVRVCKCHFRLMLGRRALALLIVLGDDAHICDLGHRHVVDVCRWVLVVEIHCQKQAGF